MEHVYRDMWGLRIKDMQKRYLNSILEADVMWYVIQTETGREQELVAAIDRILRAQSYERCFVILQECVWRIEGACKVYTH